jgi:hypothetical protein
MNATRRYGQYMVSGLLTGVLLAFGCGKDNLGSATVARDQEREAAQPFQLQEGQSPAQPKETAKPLEKVIKIAAPEKARQLWKDWNGRYVIFVHRENPVHLISDFAGRPLLCAMIETDSIVGDATQLCKAGEAKGFQIAIQNSPDVYDKNLLEDSKTIAIMLPVVAEHYKFRENPKLVEVSIE